MECLSEIALQPSKLSVLLQHSSSARDICASISSTSIGDWIWKLAVVTNCVDLLVNAIATASPPAAGDISPTSGQIQVLLQAIQHSSADVNGIAVAALAQIAAQRGSPWSCAIQHFRAASDAQQFATAVHALSRLPLYCSAVPSIAVLAALLDVRCTAWHAELPEGSVEALGSEVHHIGAYARDLAQALSQPTALQQLGFGSGAPTALAEMWRIAARWREACSSTSSPANTLQQQLLPAWRVILDALTSAAARHWPSLAWCMGERPFIWSAEALVDAVQGPHVTSRVPEPWGRYAAYAAMMQGVSLSQLQPADSALLAVLQAVQAGQLPSDTEYQALELLAQRPEPVYKITAALVGPLFSRMGRPLLHECQVGGVPLGEWWASATTCAGAPTPSTRIDSAIVPLVHNQPWTIPDLCAIAEKSVHALCVAAELLAHLPRRLLLQPMNVAGTPSFDVVLVNVLARALQSSRACWVQLHAMCERGRVLTTWPEHSHTGQDTPLPTGAQVRAVAAERRRAALLRSRTATVISVSPRASRAPAEAGPNSPGLAGAIAQPAQSNAHSDREQPPAAYEQLTQELPEQLRRLAVSWQEQLQCCWSACVNIPLDRLADAVTAWHALAVANTRSPWHRDPAAPREPQVHATAAESTAPHVSPLQALQGSALHAAASAGSAAPRSLAVAAQQSSMLLLLHAAARRSAPALAPAVATHTVALPVMRVGVQLPRLATHYAQPAVAVPQDGSVLSAAYAMASGLAVGTMHAWLRHERWLHREAVARQCAWVSAQERATAGAKAAQKLRADAAAEQTRIARRTAATRAAEGALMDNVPSMGGQVDWAAGSAIRAAESNLAIHAASVDMAAVSMVCCAQGTLGSCAGVLRALVSLAGPELVVQSASLGLELLLHPPALRELHDVPAPLGQLSDSMPLRVSHYSAEVGGCADDPDVQPAWRVDQLQGPGSQQLRAQQGSTHVPASELYGVSTRAFGQAEDEVVLMTDSDSGEGCEVVAKLPSDGSSCCSGPSTGDSAAMNAVVPLGLTPLRLPDDASSSQSLLTGLASEGESDACASQAQRTPQERLLPLSQTWLCLHEGSALAWQLMADFASPLGSPQDWADVLSELLHSLLHYAHSGQAVACVVSCMDILCGSESGRTCSALAAISCAPASWRFALDAVRPLQIDPDDGKLCEWLGLDSCAPGVWHEFSSQPVGSVRLPLLWQAQQVCMRTPQSLQPDTAEDYERAPAVQWQWLHSWAATPGQLCHAELTLWTWGAQSAMAALWRILTEQSEDDAQLVCFRYLLSAGDVGAAQVLAVELLRALLAREPAPCGDGACPGCGVAPRSASKQLWRGAADAALGCHAMAGQAQAVLAVTSGLIAATPHSTASSGSAAAWRVPWWSRDSVRSQLSSVHGQIAMQHQHAWPCVAVRWAHALVVAVSLVHFSATYVGTPSTAWSKQAQPLVRAAMQRLTSWLPSLPKQCLRACKALPLLLTRLQQQAKHAPMPKSGRAIQLQPGVQGCLKAAKAALRTARVTAMRAPDACIVGNAVTDYGLAVRVPDAERAAACVVVVADAAEATPSPAQQPASSLPSNCNRILSLALLCVPTAVVAQCTLSGRQLPGLLRGSAAEHQINEAHSSDDSDSSEEQVDIAHLWDYPVHHVVYSSEANPRCPARHLAVPTWAGTACLPTIGRTAPLPGWTHGSPGTPSGLRSSGGVDARSACASSSDASFHTSSSLESDDSDSDVYSSE